MQVRKLSPWLPKICQRKWRADKLCLLCVDPNKFACQHHIYGIRNGMETVPLCWNCHILVHTDMDYLCKLLDKLKENGQQIDIPRLVEYMKHGYKYFSEEEITYVEEHYGDKQTKGF